MEPTCVVDLAPIASETGASFSLNGKLDIGQYEVAGVTHVLRKPIEYDVTVSNIGTGFIVGGIAKAEVIVPCARCLEEFVYTTRGKVDGYFVDEGDTEGIPDEQDYELITSEVKIDIFPSILASLIFATPFVLLHDPDCAGLCAQCGANLNTEKCDCTEKPDPLSPFAALAELDLDE